MTQNDYFYEVISYPFYNARATRHWCLLDVVDALKKKGIKASFEELDDIEILKPQSRVRRDLVVALIDIYQFDDETRFEMEEVLNASLGLLC